MRTLILLLVGLAVGIAFTLIGMNYLNKGTSYANGVMAVIREQVKGLDKSIKQNRCASTDLTPYLQTLRFVANDIEPAFGEMPKNDQFIRYAGNLRAAADAAMTAPASGCPVAEAALNKIEKTCDSCHRDYRN